MRKDVILKQYKRLKEIADRCDHEFGEAVYGAVCDEARAKTLLTEFFNCLISCRPDKNLDLGTYFEYYSFLMRMLPLRNALKQQKYALACYELASLFYYEPVLQQRIYYNLISLYIKYVEEKSNAPVRKVEIPEK